EEQPGAEAAPGRSGEVRLRQLEPGLRPQAQHGVVAEADLQSGARPGLEGVALIYGSANAQIRLRTARARFLRAPFQRGDLSGLRLRRERRDEEGAQLHWPSSRSTVFAVNPITRTENFPSFFASTSCANSSVLPCSVTSSSWVPAAKLRWETLRTPRTRCESAARKSVAVRKEGTLRTVTWMSLPEETSLDQRAAIFLIMSWPNARDAFLIASFPQEMSSSCAALCVASAVERMSPLSVFTARPEIVAVHESQPGPRSGISPRTVAMACPKRITSAPVSDFSLRAWAAVISVAMPPTCTVFSAAISGSMSWPNPPFFRASRTVISAMRSSVETSALSP